MKVVDLEDAVQISVGLGTTCALRRDATVTCWASEGPTSVSGLSDVVQVSAGRSHVCAVERTGGILCWGDNGSCQSGQPFRSIGDTIPSPARVAGISDALEVAAGDEHTCARLRDGTVSCWGDLETLPIEDCEPGPDSIGCAKVPSFGALERHLEGKHVPRPIAALGDVTQLVGGTAFACARVKDGSVWCWGPRNPSASENARPEAPIRVPALENVRQISASRHTACAVDEAGQVSCWGKLWDLPELGGFASMAPARISGLGEAVDVAVGGFHACATLRDGSVWCWGSGRHGETGRGAIEAPHLPTQVTL